MRLEGKTVLVTGAAKRIGRAIAVAMAQRGARVAVHFHRSRKEAQSLVQELRATFGSDVETFEADLANLPGVRRLAKNVIRRFGALHVLVNNAATYEKTPFEAVSQADWDRFLDTNLRAAFFLSQALAPALRRAGEGKIINIADSSALKPWPDRIPYCVSKAGLLCLTQALAKALAPRIQVNAILPGALLPPKGTSAGAARIFARATLLKRLGTPEDAAKAVVFLIESDYITGASIPVDGGRLAA